MINTIDVGGLKEDQVKLVQELVEFLRAKAQSAGTEDTPNDRPASFLTSSQRVENEWPPDEEDVTLEMLEHDVVVQMPPVNKYSVTLEVKSIRKGMPVIVAPEELEG